MNDSKVVFLEGKVSYLRPYDERTDFEPIMRFVNEEETRPFMSSFIFPYSRLSEKEALERHAKHQSDNVFLVLVDKATDAPFGTMGLHRIDWLSRFATSGAMIGEKDHRGKGFGTDAKMALLRYAFNTLNLRHVWSSVLSINIRSQAYLEKTGYREIGRMPERHYRNGKYVDEIIMRVTAEEFAPLWERWIAS
jgi:RimJ/RimL family protein N-acetyltransferase